MYTEVLSPDSRTAHFGRAVDQVKNDPRCAELLGESKKITAYGEPSWNKWRRARPIACVHQTDISESTDFWGQFDYTKRSAWCGALNNALQCESLMGQK